MKQLFLPETLLQVRKHASLRFMFSLLTVLMMSVSVGWGQISITNSTAIVENFDAIGTSATASLPSNWKMSAAGAGSTANWSTTANVTATTAAANSGSPTAGGRYNWGTTAGTDRSIGFMTSGSFSSPNAIFAYYRNATGVQINDLTINFDIERYRVNTAAFSLSFFTSTDGIIWTSRSSGDIANDIFGTATSAYDFTAATKVTKTVTLTGVNLANNTDIYLKWVFVNTGNSNSQGLGLDNVSVVATLEPIGLTPPTLSADISDNTVDNNIEITFTDNTAWRSAITSITVGGTTLDPSAYSISEGKITLDPSKSTLLQSPGSKSIVVIATGYSNASVTQTINVGVPSKLSIITQPTAPASNGGNLATQPVVRIQDQYGNTTTSSANVTAAVGAGSWTLGGTATVAASSGTATFSGLSASSLASVTGATISFSSSGLTGATSNTFNISAPVITLTAAAGATVDNSFDVTFTDNSVWRAAITSITVGGTTIAVEAYTVSAGKITFDPSQSTLLQTPGSKSIVFIATGYSNASVSQSIAIGVPAKLGITTQPTAPVSNGGNLANQPVVRIQDQYGNTTTSTADVTATVGAGSWTLGGTTTRAAIGGTATFSGLTASSSDAVIGATITFTSGSLTSATSNPFNIPVLVAAPSAPTNLTFGSVSSNSFTASFTAPGTAPTGYLVLRRTGAAVTGSPVAGTVYTVGQTDINSGLNEVVYVGTSVWSAFEQASLIDNTTYHYAVYAYNGSGIQTNYSSALTGSRTTSNIGAPVASTSSSISKTGFTANWGSVNGTSEYDLDVSTRNSFLVETPSTIASEGFDNSMTLFSVTNGTASYFNGNSASGDRPASSPFAVQGTHAFGISNGSVTITSSAVNTENYGDTELSFRLASFSISSTGNGADAGDIVSVEVSADNGNTYFNLIRVLGNSNAYWAYSTGEATASVIYSVSETPLDFQPGSGGNKTTDGYSTVKITGLPSVSSLKVKITLLNNSANERWLIDDFKILGKPVSTLPSYNNLSVSGTSQTVTGLTPNTTYYYRVRATGGNSTSANSNIISVTTLGTEATDQFCSAASGDWGSNATWQSKDNTVDWFTATATPTASAASVSIENDHEVTVAASAASSSLTLKPTSRLKINSNQTLAVTGNLTLQSSDAGTATLVDEGTLTVTSGTTTVQQYLTSKSGGASTDNWWYLSSPVSGATSASILVDGSNNKFGYYNEPTANYPQITATNVTLDSGKGYLAQINTTGTYEFTGTLNTGNVGPITLTRTPAAGGPRGFNLVGNPYPSHIHWNSITGFGTQSARTDIRPTIWVRTRTASGTMDFDTFDGEDAVTKGKSGAMNGYIAPMQAFWVKVHVDNTSPTITFTNALRSAQNQNSADNRLRAPQQSNRQILRLEVSNGLNFDQMVISTNTAAQNGYDFYDSDKISASNTAIPELYSLVAGRELVIDKRTAIEPGASAIVGFRPGQAGSFNIKATELTNLDNVKVILKDNQLNTEIELLANESYTFASDATATTNRFSIEFRAPGATTSLHEVNAKNTLVYVNEANQIEVQSVALSTADRISVFNLAGQQLVSQAASGQVTVINEPFSAGVYLVKVNNHLQKVIVK